MSRTPVERVFVAGIPVAPATLDSAAEMVLDDAAASRGRVYVLVNAHSAKLRRDDPAYARLLSDQDLSVALPDGASVSAAARLLGYGHIGRSPGPDLLEVVSAMSVRDGVPAYLLGGDVGVADALREGLEARHPGLRVAGTASPPFGVWSQEDDARLVEGVRSSGARLLWMGVSAPKQEVWAHRHARRLGMPIVCVGAAFDFNTGVKSRAPEWMRRAGLEWVHRLATEPRRMWKRYLVGNVLFVWDVMKYGRRRAAG